MKYLKYSFYYYYYMINNIIIGGGISGLYLCNKIKDSIVIEQKKRIGGRIKTYNDNNIIYESGAYRFSEKHILLKELIKNLNLNNYIEEIDNKKEYFLRNTNNKLNNIYNTNNKLK